MANFEIEKSLGSNFIAGIDEAGRGPLAGPVVASAVRFRNIKDCEEQLKDLNDSKQVSKKKREELYRIIMSHADVGIGISSVEEIDRDNILQATFKAMERALDDICTRVEIALIDGNRQPKGITIESHLIVKGDSKSYSIAAASIIAKVTRDNIMENLDKEYPEYKWNRNAGYGVKAHIEAIEKYGITPHHRKTFAPINQRSFF